MSTRRPTVLGESAPSPAHSGDATPVDPAGAFNQLVVVALIGLSVVLASKFRDLLDQKFRFDGDYIQALLAMPDASLDSADPFRNTALVYRVLGLSGAPDVAAMVAIALFGVAILAALRWGELLRLTPFGLAIIAVCQILALIYLSQYSKELVSLALVTLVLLLPRGPVAELALIGAMVGYAMTIRPYWGIVVVLFVAGRLLLPRLRGLLPVLLLVAATFAVLQLGFNSFLGEALSFSRTSVNDLRAQINVSVGSLIVDFLPDQVGLQWLNALLVFGSLLLPWPLILGGSSVYLLMSGVVAILWGVVGWAVRKLQHEHAALRGRPVPPARTASLMERTPRPERAAALLLALVVVQAIFEPDYGSYLKHLAPMLPLFVALLPLRPRRSATSSIRGATP